MVVLRAGPLTNLYQLLLSELDDRISDRIRVIPDIERDRPSEIGPKVADVLNGFGWHTTWSGIPEAPYAPDD